MKRIFILLTSLFVIACGSDKKEDNKQPTLDEKLIILTKEQADLAGIATTKPGMRNISSVLKVNGKIDVPPQNMVSISVPFGGFLRSSHLLPGMKVKKGEIIAVMEDQQYIQLQQDYLMAKNSLAYLEKEYQRQKDLMAGNATSEKIFQQAESDYKSQVVIVKSLGEKLQLIHIDPVKLNESTISRSINILAPIDGFVSTVNINIGKYVNPADVLFELVNPNDIHLNLNVFERDISKLHIGQKLMAYTNNDYSKKHECEIILIGQNLSPERSVEVHCHFLDYDHSLIPGMYMNAEINVKDKNTLVIEHDAILSSGPKNYVFIDKGKNAYELTEVKLGITNDEYAEILSPENIKEMNVVNKGAYSLWMQLMNKAEEE